MQRIYLRLEGANLVSPLLELWLQQLLEAAAVPVQWEELTGLANLPPSSLFQPDFVGFAELRTVLDNLVCCLFYNFFLHLCDLSCDTH